MRKEFQIGDWLLGQYQIKEKLGRGAMGCVYKAWHKTSEIDVAIKMVPPEVSVSTLEMDAVKENFRIVQKLNHPNIASLKQLERIEETGEYFIVMEYVPGVNLAMHRRTFDGGRIPVAEAVRITGEIAAGLDCAHRQRVMHRDVKPENIMVAPSGEVKILDFGLAMQIMTTATRLTNSPQYDVSGTRPYMAPEQWLGQKQDGASDIYALGVLFYEMVTGRPPFSSSDFEILMNLVLTQPPQPISETGGCINKALGKALAKERKNRYKKAGEFAAALEKCLYVNKRKALLVAAAVLLAVLVSAGAFYYKARVEAEKQKELLERRAEIQKKLEEITPEIMVGKKEMAHYDRALAILSTEIAKSLNQKGLLDNHKMAITGFREAETEEICPLLTISLRERVTNNIFKIESRVGCNITADPRGNFETIENEIIYSGKGEVQIDLDAVRHLGDPDILITGTWLNGKENYYLTLRAYKREPISRERDEGQGDGKAPDGKKIVEVFTIVTSSGLDVPKEDGLRSELLGCIENTRKIPPVQIVDSRVSPGRGDLRITTTPEGATIYIRGEKQAEKSPLTAKGLLEGEAEARAELADFNPEIRTVRVDANRENNVDLALKRARTKISVKAYPEDATIKISGIGDPYSDGMYLPMDGDYALEVSAPEYVTYNGKVALEDKPENEFEISLEKRPPKQGDVVESAFLKGMKFVYIPSDSFAMGSPSSEPKREDDERQHQVTLTRGFYLQTTEVTQGQWEAVMGNNPSRFKDCGPKCPVEQVSWDDVQEFVRKLNGRDGKTGYRLPSEAEWEYAARAGTTTPFAFGDCLSTGQANYDGNYPMPGCAKGEYRKTTVPADSFSPNKWGLYNMHGNVWEWCQDWYGDYPSEAVRDPKGPGSGSARVFRGGSWFNSAGTAGRPTATAASRPTATTTSGSAWSRFQVISCCCFVVLFTVGKRSEASGGISRAAGVVVVGTPPGNAARCLAERPGLGDVRVALPRSGSVGSSLSRFGAGIQETEKTGSRLKVSRFERPNATRCVRG